MSDDGRTSILRPPPFFALLLAASACKSRGARPDDVPRPVDAAPATSASPEPSASIAPAPESSATKSKPAHAWFGGPRDRSLVTEKIEFPIDGTVEYFHASASEGVLARVANARIDRMLFAARPKDYFGPVPSGLARSNQLVCDGFVTARVLSWSCSDMTYFIDLALAAQGMGGAPAGAEGSYFAVTFSDPEQVVGDNLARADLFRGDPHDEIAKRCAEAVAHEVQNPEPGEASLCEKADDFVVDDVGLTLFWFPPSTSGSKNIAFQRSATVRWRAFGRKLRSDGAACSFEWSAPNEEDGPSPLSQDEACK